MIDSRSSVVRQDDFRSRPVWPLALLLCACFVGVTAPSWAASEVTETTLANGIRVLEIAPLAEEARPSPVADFEVWVPAGAWFEPDTAPGLATVTAETLIRAGTKWHGAADTVAILRDRYRIHLEANVGSEYVRFQLWCEDPKARAFAAGLLVMILRAPHANESIVEEAVAALESGSDPASIEYRRKQVSRAWNDRHPAARPTRGQAPTWDAVVGFYGHYRPEGVVVGTQGPLTPRVLSMLEGWRVEAERPASPSSGVLPGSGPSISIVPSEREVGAVLVRGVAGLDAETRTNWVRTLRAFDARRGTHGSTMLPAGGGRMTVRIPIAPGDDLATSITETIDRLGSFPAKLLEESVLDPVTFEGAAAGDVWATVVMCPAGSLHSDLSATSSKVSDWFDLTQYHLVVHGPMSLAPTLGRYGIPVEIAPVGEYPRDGSELWARIVEAAGGKRLDDLRALGWTAQRFVNSEEGVQESTTRSIVEFPLRMWVETESKVAIQTTIFNGNRGWTAVDRKPTPDLPNPAPSRGVLPEPSARDYRRSLLLATTPLLCVHREVEVEELAPEFVEGATLRVIKVTRPNIGSVEFLVEAETHRIRRKRMTQNSPLGQLLIEESLDNYAEFDGIWLPKLRTIYQNAVERVRIVTGEYEVNPEIPAGRFESPKAGQS